MFPFARVSLLRTSLRSMPIILGAAYVTRPRLVFNDAVMTPRATRPAFEVRQPLMVREKLNYRDLCVGSMTGLFLGIIIGKLSTTLAFLAASAYLFLQFLENRGIVTVPWQSVVRMGKKQIDLHTLFFENVGFKLSFVSTFLLAAWNI